MLLSVTMRGSYVKRKRNMCIYTYTIILRLLFLGSINWEF